MDGLKSITKEVNNSKIDHNPKITSLSKLSSNIKNNTLLAVNTLIKNFLTNVMDRKNPIKIHDTKELRDVISVFQVIENVASGTNSATPQINTNAINFIDNQMREPHDPQGTKASINKKLPSLNDKQVKKLFRNQEKQLDKQNLKKM